MACGFCQEVESKRVMSAARWYNETLSEFERQRIVGKVPGCRAYGLTLAFSGLTIEGMKAVETALDEHVTKGV